MTFVVLGIAYLNKIEVYFVTKTGDRHYVFR